MKTSTFIEKQAVKMRNGEPTKGHCSSVFAETSAVYSYGYHYPLLFTVVTPSGKMLLVTNSRGYSSTTSKHISYATQHSDISVPLAPGDRYGSHYSLTSVYEMVVKGALVELESVRATIATKKRKDTWVYSDLERQEKNMIEALHKLEYKF